VAYKLGKSGVNDRIEEHLNRVVDPGSAVGAGESAT